MIDEAFRRQVARRPDQPAVRGWDTELTYRELDRRASELADRLWHAGVRPGAVVGLHLERSAAGIAGLVAILRVGAAYLALDRREPAGRRRTILADAAVRAVLTRRDLAPELPPGAGPLIYLDEPADEAGGTVGPAPAARPDPRVGPAHVAYLAYTSGSTGRPKGVCVPHRAVCRLVLDSDYLPIHADDVFVQYAPLAFDASTLEIWGPLLNGARLVVPPPADPSPAQLGAFVRAEGVTVLWLTAGLFHRVVEAGLADLRGLRHLLAGGDVLSVPQVNRALAALPDTVMVNGYGPTENTTFTCCHRMRSPVRDPSVPVGRPVRGTTVYLLDERLRPVGHGEIGELYAAGTGLAHGYLGAPALTAQRFLPDPFDARPGGRMYRTGDLARWRRDGALEFHGRVDRQVKIRGFRVEPAEVESALAGLPGVREAAVVPDRGRGDELRLVAFVTGSAPVPQVREHLAARLPDYAVPGLIARVDALPLTPNGKVDRAALATWARPARPELSTAFRRPGTALERAVVALWGELLAVVEIGADDDFFELGGDSLIGAQILGHLRATYGVRVTPREFYLAPTPAGLARAVAAGAAGAAGAGQEPG